MPTSVTVQSYAKVNYTLDVLSRRQDGYHDLASVMQTVSLHDTLTVEPADAPGVTLRCTAPGVPADATNLAAMAATRLLEVAAPTAGVVLHLEKRIPVQAGLGGGSSNAAAALRGVRAALDLPVDDARLAALASALGSDVPFFLIGGTAAVRGRGELITPLVDGPELWFVIVKPATDVPTGPAYAALDALAERLSARATRRMEAAVASSDPAEVAARMANDFEQVAFAHHPLVSQAMDDLLMARAPVVHLCGSGAAVMGVLGDRSAAESVARVVGLRHADVFVCNSVCRERALALEAAGAERAHA